MMNEDFWAEVWRRHRGKIIGLGGGFVFALLTVTLGLGKAIFILLCLGLGYWVGKRIDESEGWRKLWERIFRD